MTCDNCFKSTRHGIFHHGHGVFCQECYDRAMDGRGLRPVALKAPSRPVFEPEVIQALLSKPPGVYRQPASRRPRP